MGERGARGLMAEEHNAIKYGTTISKAGAVATGGAYGDVGISRLSETLTPIIDLWARPEWALLRGEIHFARFVSGQAVAGRFSGFEVVNPAGASKIAVVRLKPILASDQLQAVIDFGAAIAANPVTNRGVALDARYPSVGEVSQCTIVTGDYAGGVVLPQWLWRAATTVVDAVSPEWVLVPGSKLFVLTGAILQVFYCNVLIRERSPFPGELQARG